MLRRFPLVLLLLPGLLVQPAGSAPAPVPEYRVLWVDAYHDGFKTPEQVDRLVADARSVGANALFVQVRRRGDAYYASGVEPRADDPDLAPGFDPLGYLLDRARRGAPPLEVHAWLATLAIWGPGEPPADPGHVFNQHGPGAVGEEDWLQRSYDGAAWAGDAYYLDPGHPAVAEHTVRVVLDLVRRYPVDGLHLDRLRYAEGGRWGYNPVSVARFNARSGRSGLPAPDDPDWSEWRRAQVSALLRRVYLEALAVRPSLVVSAAAVAWGDPPGPERPWEEAEPYRSAFQDWRSWLEEGSVDLAVPMNYVREGAPGGPERLEGWLAWQRGVAGRRGLVVGLGAYLNRPEETQAQAQRALAPGSGGARPLGLALYSYASPTGEPGAPAVDALRALAQPAGPFAGPAVPPRLPWKAGPTAGHLLIEVPGLEGARVVARGPIERVGTTDGRGFCGLIDLPPGEYTVVVEAEGLAPAGARVRVEPGRVGRLALARAAG